MFATLAVSKVLCIHHVSRLKVIVAHLTLLTHTMMFVAVIVRARIVAVNRVGVLFRPPIAAVECALGWAVQTSDIRILDN